MIVPDHWAQARKQHRAGGKQITVRRFGWSMLSEEDARTMAEQRAEEALQRILSGEALTRRERKTAYSGADGVPIREEVLSRHDDEVITRNSYGAHCLNSPRALFADVDFDSFDRRGFAPALLAFVVLVAATATASWHFQSPVIAFWGVLASLALAVPAAAFWRRVVRAAQGGSEQAARARVQVFLSKNPSWALRLYRTPRGLRLLVTHQLFDATAPQVQQFFSAVGADPVYVRMCINQRCFRARLTGKPWRMDMATRMTPRPGVWPVQAEHMAMRRQWVAAYEQKAAQFAACRFVEAMGSGAVHIDMGSVIELHDTTSRAMRTQLPMA